MGDDMEKLIYKVTKPYVYEMLVASVIDLMLSMLVFVIVRLQTDEKSYETKNNI